jgi:DNA-binding XRE family transcriptional regulator
VSPEIDRPPPVHADGDIDVGAIASRVKALVAEALGRFSTPLDIVVKVSRDRVDVSILPSRAATAGGATWSFAQWFRGLLRERSVTQDALARVLGVSSKTVNRWSRGETEPRFRELMMIYEILGESPFVSTHASPSGARATGPEGPPPA